MQTAKKNLQKCNFCDHTFSKDKSQCPSCKGWNIAPVEREIVNDGVTSLMDTTGEDDSNQEFIQTGPWDPCFGRNLHDDGTFEYGIPKGAVALLGGKNGAGKSTLVMQTCESVIAATKREVVIVSVEEAKKQVRRLAKRLKLEHADQIMISKGDVELDIILHKRKPAMVVVDSLPRLCPNLDDAVEFCKRLKAHVELLNIPAIVINHINKEEEFAGLEALQHEVDATLIFTIYPDEVRQLRSLKNRNGPLAEVLFNMTDTGLVERSPEEDAEEEDDDE